MLKAFAHKASINFTRLKLRSRPAQKMFLLAVFPFLTIGVVLAYRDAHPKNVKAFGSLIVDFGVPEGEPIFDFDDFKPGDCVDHTINVENTGDDTVMVVLKAEDTTNPDQLPNVLEVIIQENGTDLYGGGVGHKTLEDLFEDSQSGINLSPLSGGASTDYGITICFDINAGNEHQKSIVVFDIIFKTSLPPIELPEECSHLTGIITKVIEGTPENDRIHGSTANELIITYEGNDRIHPSSGHDCIVAGPGDDRVIGTSGNEVVIGGKGNDRLNGGSGNDIIYAGPGNDRVNLGSGEDTAYGGDGDDRIRGGSGDDTIFGGGGNDRLWGDSGNDSLDGEGDIDNATGNSGVDTCEAESESSCEL